MSARVRSAQPGRSLGSLTSTQVALTTDGRLEGLRICPRLGCVRAQRLLRVSLDVAPAESARKCRAWNNIDGEILLVDDGSKDGSWKAIETLVAKDSRVRGLKFAKNCGETAASDAGLRNAARHVGWCKVDLHAESGEHIGRA